MLHCGSCFAATAPLWIMSLVFATAGPESRPSIALANIEHHGVNSGHIFLRSCNRRLKAVLKRPCFSSLVLSCELRRLGSRAWPRKTAAPAPHHTPIDSIFPKCMRVARLGHSHTRPLALIFYWIDLTFFTSLQVITMAFRGVSYSTRRACRSCTDRVPLPPSAA